MNDNLLNSMHFPEAGAGRALASGIPRLALEEPGTGLPASWRAGSPETIPDLPLKQPGDTDGWEGGFKGNKAWGRTG